ncbi:unnamed protein product [Cuscuta epithymum]|nr:unnamed protein product [Cuscuta epithymum]
MSKGASRAYAIVQFSSNESSEEIINLAKQHKLYYRTSFLTAKELVGTQIMEPKSYAHEMEKVAVCFGCQTRRDGFHVLWRKRNISVKFGIGFKYVFLLLFHGSTQYKLQLSRQGISRITQYYPQVDQNAKFLVIQMFSAPRIYKKTEESIYTFFKETPDDHWVRTTDFTQNCIIGHSSALCLNLHLDVELPNLCDDFAYDNQIVTHFTMDYGSSFSSNSVIVPIFHPPLGIELPFKLHFKICSLVQHGCLPGPSLNDEFFALVDPGKVDINLIEYALEKMYRLKECCYDPVKWLTEQYHCKFKHMIKSNVIKLDEGLMYVRRVIVTPMRVYFCGPDAILSNRVLRHYCEDIDNFVRVSFMDEDWERMHSVDLSPSPPTNNGVVVRTDIFNRIMKILENGIVIGDKAFEFLAFSSSQLRESSLWMFASRPGLSATDIRSWMGDFKKIKNVAKYAARLGQSFGSSRETFVVGKDEIQMIPDIEIHTEGKNYTFSDGIGKISADFAQKVAIKCGLMKHPSAFQIRYGGFKGVVSVDPSSSKKLSLRKSMLKFESENIKLDILAWSRYQPCYLNRQIITLLSSLGIHDHVFEKKQRKVVGLMDKMLIDPNMAQKFLKLMPSGENTKLLIAMLNCGYKPHIEPFLSMMLQTIKASMVEDLRTRTRILIPNGRSMMGCMDETRTLEYGQVFIKFSVVDRGHYSQLNEYDNILVGKVVVAKNPCLHPGDVRILQAIDVPVLHHMVDCIVFPQQGDRPHPDECSGSDLDGDFYYVCWDNDLIPRSMVPPMDYTPPATQLQCDVTIEDIRKYFVEYIMNDTLGMISNAHVVVADREPTMAMSEPCMQLAHLFSIAVDFPKTGVPAEMPSNLRIKKYPDFMQKFDKPSYKSTRIIGKLFRQVQSIPRSSAAPFSKERAKKLYDMDMEVDGFEDHICKALEHKKLYDYKLGSLMDYYDIKTEAEIVSGRITNPTTRLFDRRRDSEAVILAYRSLRKEARSWFEKGRNSECSDDLKVKASAWYHVTYHHTYWGCYEEDEMRREHFISFPWCIYEELIQIKKDRSNTIWGAQFSSLEWTCNIC